MKKFNKIIFFLFIALAANADLVKNSENTIKDTKTNFIWQDTQDVSSIKRSFHEAKEYCQKLELDGINSWKVPGFVELFSIVNTKEYNPTISKTFKYITSDNYWSSKTFGHSSTKEAFAINFLSGAFNREKMDQSFYIRCYTQNK